MKTWNYNSYPKINIGLKVYKKKYKKQSKHKIKSIFFLIDEYADLISIEDSKKNKITYIQKNKEIFIKDDLIIKTIKYLNNYFNLKNTYSILIKKYIPMGSGLGGASSNAAIIIKHFIKTNNLDIKKLNLKEVALHLGSDIPFFLFDYKCAYVYSYGEKVSLIKEWNFKYELFPNNLSNSTKHIFELFDKSINKNKNNIMNVKNNMSNLKDVIISNDLQSLTLKENKELEKIYTKLILKYNNNIILTGSGSFFIRIIV